jgi:hypothetical protein
MNSKLLALLGVAVLAFAPAAAKATTFTIPGDYPGLQAAVDAVGQNAQVTLSIQSGHALTAPLTLANGDWSGIAIQCEDPVVPLEVGFSGTVIEGANAAMPSLDCLIDAANQVDGNGVVVNSASRMHIAPGAGVKNVYGTGLLARGASNVSATETVWTGAARNGNTGAGITSWGAHIDAESADVSNSNYYGAQAAHGGVLNFRLGNATNAYRYGVRATDAGFLDFDGAGVIGIYAFNGSRINARSAKATGCGGSGSGGNVAATNNSHINGTEGIFAPGGIDYAIYSTSGSTVSANNAITKRFGSTNPADMQVSSGGIIASKGANGGRNVTANTLTASGIIFN